jgi:predicted MFS family arabinose efflux permease
MLAKLSTRPFGGRRFHMDPDTAAMPFVRLRVFTFFALGYFVSYLFRGVNIGFAPQITRELGLSAGDLGLLTSLYFLGFAAAQIPAGVLLDRYGSRRTNAALMIVAAAGIYVFGQAQGIGTLMAGRLLIGIGVSVAFGGACKAIAQYFPAKHLPLLYGLVLAIGGLGGVLVGTPLTWLLTLYGWRAICGGIALFTLGVAGVLMLGTPERPEPDRGLTIRDQLRGTAAILASRYFWRVAPFSVVTQGVFYAAQSLWVGAYMRDVSGLDAGQAGRLVSILGLAMMVGSVLFGLLARAMERLGLSVLAFSGIGMALFVVDQGLIIAGAPLPAWALWTGYGFFGGVGILTYAILAEAFPAGMIGRVNTTLTLLLFLTIFVFQAGIGLILSLWPQVGGHHPAAAHQWVWSGLVVLETLSAIPYLVAPRRRL